MNETNIQLPYNQNALRFVYLVLLVGLLANTEVLAQDFWQQTNGPYGGNIHSLAIAPNGHIFSGTDAGGIFRSTDNGGSWVQVNIDLTSTLAAALAINSSGHIFAGASNGRVFRSTDNGVSWTSNFLPNVGVFSLATNPSGHIFAGTNPGGVYLSTDNGASWRYSGVVGTNVRSLTINSSGQIFAGTARNGVYRSTDNGNNWKQINAGLTNIDVRALAADSSGQIWAGTFGSRIFRSNDNGENWALVYSGRTDTYIGALSINNLNGHIFAGIRGVGISRSTNNGTNWTVINAGLTNTKTQSIAINSSGHVFAGTDGGGIFRTTNNGESWTPINTGLTNATVSDLAFNSSGHIFAGTDDGVFRSTDNGGGWIPINTGLTNLDVRALAINSGGDIFAGTSGGGVFRSIDNSGNWTSINAGLTHSFVHALIINNSTGHIFAGTYEGGIFRSTDNGTNWTNVMAGKLNTSIVSFAIKMNGDIFAGTDAGEVFRSTDNGNSWTSANNGLAGGVYAFAINSSGDIFAGTWGGGVFLSTNNGDNWKRINNGLTNLSVFALAINSSGYIFAGTSGGGIFRSMDKGENWASVNTGLTSPYIIALGINSGGQFFAGTNGGGVFLSERLSRNPSSVAHTPVVQQETGKEIFIKAKINDDIGIARATLYYRIGGETKFSRAPLTFTKNDSFQATIPANTVTSRGVEYYIVATARDSLTSPWPSSGYFSVRVRVNGEMNKNPQGAPIPQPSGSDQNAYRLFSVPLDLDAKSAEAVLVDDLGARNIKKWRFHELRDDYLKLPSSASIHNEFPNTSEMRPGKGFWLIVKDSSKIIDTGAGLSNLTDKAYPLALHPGWNYIGNPFNFRIPKTNLRLKSKDAPPQLRFFSGAWNDTTNSKIEGILPFEGYAVFADSTAIDDTLWVDPDLSFSASSLAKLAAGQGVKPLWSIRIRAQCQEARDVDNIAAVASTASSFSDPNDLPEPPVIGEYVSVYFPHPEWGKLAKTYCTDVRPMVSDGEIWLFEVKTNIRDKVYLTFGGLDAVPLELEVWLLDDALNITQNLREHRQYAVAGADHPKRLKLVVGKRDFIDGKGASLPAIPTVFELSQNFPNPFNPVTTIRYGLPQAGRVTLKVYNLLGAEMVALVDDELKAAGYHAVIWDGTNNMGKKVASGVYFSRLRAENAAADSKKVFMRTKKMLLIE